MAAKSKPSSQRFIDQVSDFVRINLGLVLVASLFFVAHLPGITTPPLDEHAWRQTDTAAVVRNFSAESANIFLPRIDMRSNFSGITGMEFPLYNYLVAGTNVVFGFTHWHGRVLSLLFAMSGLGMFYFLLNRRYGKGLANVATALMALSPLYFLFAKNIQPDMLMLALAIAALYFTQVYIDSKKAWAIYVAIACLSVAMLVKIPIIFVSLPMIYMIGWQRITTLVNVKIVAFCIAVLVLPNAAWYLWSAHLSSHYGLGQYFYGDISITGSLHLAVQKGFWRTIADYLLPMRFPAVLLYVFAGLGVVIALIKKQYLGLIWFGSFVVFIGGFAIKSFYHNYYSLPLVPSLALIMAIGIFWLYQKVQDEDRLMSKVLVVLAVAAMTLAFFNRSANLYAAQLPTSYVGLEAIMNSISDPKDLIVTNGAGTPEELYFANRKGWSLTSSNITIPEARQSLSMLGAKYIVVDLSTTDGTTLEQVLDGQGVADVYKDNSFAIYRL